MDDTAQLLVSLFVSVVGFGLFIYGKKQHRVPQLVVGILMMVLPYFTPGAILTGSVGVGLVVLMGLGIRMGL